MPDVPDEIAAEEIESLDELLEVLRDRGYSDADLSAIEAEYAEYSLDELQLLCLERAFRVGPAAPEPLEPLELVTADEVGFGQGT